MSIVKFVIPPRPIVVDGRMLTVALHETGVIDIKDDDYGAVFKIAFAPKLKVTRIFLFPESSVTRQEVSRNSSWHVDRRRTAILTKGAKQFAELIAQTKQEKDYILSKYHSHYVPDSVSYAKGSSRTIFVAIRGNIDTYHCTDGGRLVFGGHKRVNTKELPDHPHDQTLWWATAFRKMVPLGANRPSPSLPQQELFTQSP